MLWVRVLGCVLALGAMLSGCGGSEDGGDVHPPEAVVLEIINSADALEDGRERTQAEEPQVHRQVAFLSGDGRTRHSTTAILNFYDLKLDSSIPGVIGVSDRLPKTVSFGDLRSVCWISPRSGYVRNTSKCTAVDFNDPSSLGNPICYQKNGDSYDCRNLSIFDLPSNDQGVFAIGTVNGDWFRLDRRVWNCGNRRGGCVPLLNTTRLEYGNYRPSEIVVRRGEEPGTATLIVRFGSDYLMGFGREVDYFDPWVGVYDGENVSFITFIDSCGGYSRGCPGVLNKTVNGDYEFVAHNLPLKGTAGRLHLWFYNSSSNSSILLGMNAKRFESGGNVMIDEENGKISYDLSDTNPDPLR